VILTGFFGQSQAGANVADGADNVPISPKLAINVQTIDGSVIAAHIEVSSDGKTFSSDLSGINVYEISLPNGRYEITVSQPGYFASKQEINLEKDLAIIAALAKIPVPIAETPVPQPVVTRQPSTVHENIKNSKKTSPKSTKAPQRTATPSPATSADSVRTDMSVAGILDQINHQRSVNGLNSVSLNQTLSSAATAKAKDMATKNYFAHTSSEGIDDFYFINQVGYSWQAAGINLADGSFGDAKGLVDAWMNSSGHRANILATFGREIGIAIYGKYFVMMIASPR
jgi:uncharacterized protein YkwD